MKPSNTNDCATPDLYRLDPKNLLVGEPLPGTLYTDAGRVILREGRILEPDLLTRLKGHQELGLFGDAEWSPDYFDESEVARPADTVADDQLPDGNASKDYSSLSVDDLLPGTRLISDIYSNRGALLARKGAEITEAFLNKLKQYCIFEVQMEAPATEDQSDPPKTKSVSKGKGRNERTSGQERIITPSELQTERERGKAVYEQSIDRVEETMRDAFKGRKTSATAIRDLISEFVGLLRIDSGLLPGLMQIGEMPSEYLYQHGLNVAVLAMSAAASLDLPDHEVAEIGLGAIMPDIGMLQVPESLRFAARPLTQAERAEVQRHPIYSVNLLQRLGVPEASVMIAYQAHERPDRSGYPNGRHRMLIHPYARLVSAADTYVAMTSERSHRPFVSPYEAMRTLLEEANQNMLDAGAVRTILDCMSLFPLGSYVDLSDGTSAKVIRANPGQHTKPVVVALDADGSESGIEVDLAGNNRIHVVRALESAPKPVNVTPPSTSTGGVAPSLA